MGPSGDRRVLLLQAQADSFVGAAEQQQEHLHHREPASLPDAGGHARRLVRAAALHRLRKQGKRRLRGHQLHHASQRPGPVHRVVQERDHHAGAVAAAVPGRDLLSLPGEYRPQRRRRQCPECEEGGRAARPRPGRLPWPRPRSRVQHHGGNGESGPDLGAHHGRVPHHPAAAPQRHLRPQDPDALLLHCPLGGAQGERGIRPVPAEPRPEEADAAHRQRRPAPRGHLRLQPRARTHLRRPHQDGVGQRGVMAHHGQRDHATTEGFGSKY